ncbi:Ig-like domain-containing protein [Sulfurospirillum arcachonense]|uniref:Ig-like domain-containing protein n=1 Tax=Sulfurospirillum arcachonense TaxID=57666 RepID=UPI0004680907|nr:Ig-like domain-containing protein [Sulfurospirillum arcachonense]
MKIFLSTCIILLSSLSLWASDICQAFNTPLQTRTESSTINFSPNGGASYLYGNTNTSLDTSVVVNRQVGWWPFASYDDTCKEMKGISDAPCVASKNLGKSINLEDLRFVKKHNRVDTVATTNKAIYNNYGQGLTSKDVLKLDSYDTIESGWYPDLQMNIEVSNTLHVNHLSTPSSNSILNFQATSNYDVFIDTLNLNNKTTTKFDSSLQTLKINTLSMNIENKLNIEALKEVSIGSLKINPNSSLLIKTPKLVIDSFKESASSTPNTISLIADSIDITTLNLADNTILNISPYLQSEVTVTIGNVKTGSRTQLKLFAGNYHISSLFTNGSSGKAAINTDGLVTMLIGSDLTLLSGNSLNFSKDAKDLLLLVKGNVNLQSNTKTAATIYAQGDINLQSGATLKGALSAKSRINLYHNAKVYADVCSGSSTGVDIASLNIKVEKNEIKEQTTTSLQVNATYSDGSIKDITENISWSIQDNSIVSIDNNILKALKEGTTTLSATVDNTTSNTVTITVYKEINGYKLPPEPDETLNNSTLLGIDSNNNGVRDDVEIYIIKKYANETKFPKTKTAIELQTAWASQKILEIPTIESDKYLTESIACRSYWFDKQTVGMSGFEAGKYRSTFKIYTPEFMDKMYNTRERIEQKFSFNEALSGNILKGSEKEGIDNCRTNIDKLGE